MMKVIIIDDEPKAIDLLSGYLEHYKNIEIIRTFRNALKAFEFIKGNSPDLIFLDINMPHLSGIALSKMIDPSIRIIFTTAYAEFAVESYELNAFDYLLKPISFERFAKSVNKVMEERLTISERESSTIMVKSGNKLYRVNLDELLYLEKDGNYMYYHLNNAKIMARESVGDALKKIPLNFVQCHKSYIVNIYKIDFLNRHEVSINSNMIPIGAAYNEGFLRKVQ